MRKVGDYEWRQLSMWDFAPKNCVEKYVRSSCGAHIFHYYLLIITEVVSESHVKVKTVESDNLVPNDVLNWRNSSYTLRDDGNRHKKEVAK